MDMINHLFDLPSAAIVIGGTLVATLLRCGWRESWIAAKLVAQLPTRAFNSARVRSEMAVQIQEIRRDGFVRAEPHQFGDGEFDELSETLIRHRSIEGLHEEHERHRARRAVLAGTAGRVLAEAAELAPVLGLAGTLLALGGLSDAVTTGSYGPAIGAAVTTTLYGLIAANFLFAPLSTAVERRARAEERERRELLDWLAEEVGRRVPDTRNAPAHQQSGNTPRVAA